MTTTRGTLRTTEPVGDAADRPRPPVADGGSRRAWIRPALVGVVAAVAATALVLRFVTGSALWLDEAQTVAIARLPVGQLFTALRHDGSPPAYYLLLHAWMKVAGTGAPQVRALSGVVSVVTIPVLWFVGRRVAGRTTAWCAVVVLASSPFAVRYGSETRMYSLVMFLVVLGWLVVLRARERPSITRLAPVAALSAALLLTHYWSLYLLAAVAVLLGLDAWRHHNRASQRVAVALASGALAFLPWLPDFLYQVRHTGAPWATAPTLADELDALRAYSGGDDSAAWILWLVLLALVAVGIFGRRIDRGVVAMRWAGREPGRHLALAVGVTMSLALVTGAIDGSPVTARYTAVVFPLFVVVAALGLRALDGPLRMGVLAVIAVTGLFGGVSAATAQRTQAPDVARVLRAEAQPGDLVVYCPDQLGPSTSRLLGDGVRQVTYPSFAPAARVDWVDYRARIAHADPFVFALTVDRMAPTGDVWLVIVSNYIAVGPSCRQLQLELESLRPVHQEPVSPSGHYFESMGLERFTP